MQTQFSNSEPTTTHFLLFQSTSQHILDSPACVSSVYVDAERPQLGYRIDTESESSPVFPAALQHAD